MFKGDTTFCVTFIVSHSTFESCLTYGFGMSLTYGHVPHILRVTRTWCNDVRDTYIEFVTHGSGKALTYGHVPHILSVTRMLCHDVRDTYIEFVTHVLY